MVYLHIDTATIMVHIEIGDKLGIVATFNNLVLLV